MKALLFTFVISSALLSYSTYRFYALLKSEKVVSRRLKTAFDAMVESQSKKSLKKVTTKRK